MILDHIDNIGMYGGLGERIAAGLALLKEERVLNAAPGKYDVQGEELFFAVSEYTSKPIDQCRLEVHQKYMDIQVVVSGSESIGYVALDGLTLATPYDADKDVAFFEVPQTASTLALVPGMFAIFWPNEPHRPGMRLDEPQAIKKIVVKIKME